MKSLLAVMSGFGLLLAASAASAACSGHVSADAKITPIVTADTATPSPVVTDRKADDKG